MVNMFLVTCRTLFIAHVCFLNQFIEVCCIYALLFALFSVRSLDKVTRLSELYGNVPGFELFFPQRKLSQIGDVTVKFF